MNSKKKLMALSGTHKSSIIYCGNKKKYRLNLDEANLQKKKMHINVTKD